MVLDDAPLCIVYSNVLEVPDHLRSRTRLTEQGELILLIDDLSPEERSAFWDSVIEAARAGNPPHLQRGTGSS